MNAESIYAFLPDFIWGLSAFVVFVLILLKLGVKPIADGIAAREAKLAKELAESESAYAKAKKLSEDLDLQLRGAEAKISEMMAEARRDAEALKAAQVEEGRKDIDAIRHRSLREIEAARNSALVDLRNQVVEIAALVAEKAIGERLDTAKHAQLITDAVARFDGQRN
jgi:F-type H+-transporting ATPase subunit b